MQHGFPEHAPAATDRPLSTRDFLRSCAMLLLFVGAASAAMLLLLKSQGKSFRTPAERELLSLGWPRESSQREGHPASAPCGHPVRKVRVRATGFVDSTSCADDKLAGIHAGHPSGFSSARPPLQRGPINGARHRGAHSVRSGKPLRKARGVKLWLSLLLLAPSPPLRGGEGWGEGALFTPLCGGESGTTRPRSGAGMDAGSFSLGQESGRKARPRLTNLPGASPASAKRGGFLFGYFLLATQEKVARAPQEGESSCSVSTIKSKSIAHKCAPTEKQQQKHRD